MEISNIRSIPYTGLNSGLEDAVYSIDPAERVAGVDVIGMMRETAYLRQVLELSYDTEEAVCQAARRALMRFGEGVAPRLIAIADENTSDEMPRCAAVRALGMLGIREVSPLLLQILKEGSPSMRSSAISALSEMGLLNDAIEAHLIEALHETAAPNVWIAATALGQLGCANASEHLVRLIDHPDRLIAGSAIRALGQLRTPSTTDMLIEQLGSNDLLLVEEVIDALGEIGDERAVPPLIRQLLQVQVNPYAFRSHYGSRHVFEDSWPSIGLDIERAIIRAIENIGAPAVPYLVEAIARGEEQREQPPCETEGRLNRLFVALARIGTPALPAFEDLLHDRDSRVREEACNAIRTMEPGASGSLTRKLISIALTDPCEDVGDAAVRALITQNLPEVCMELLSAVEVRREGWGRKEVKILDPVLNTALKGFTRSLPAMSTTQAEKAISLIHRFIAEMKEISGEDNL